MIKEANFAFSGDFGDDDAVADCDFCGRTYDVEDLEMAKYCIGKHAKHNGDQYICPNCRGVPEHILRGADTFEAHGYMQDAKDAIDWLFDHSNFANLRQIQEYLNEKMPRKDAA